MAETKRKQAGTPAGKQTSSQQAGGRSPRRRIRKDNRPQEIVAAAFEEFAVKGYAGTRLEDVAARAKVSKGLPYLYFKTKEELFKAVVRSVITSHFDVIRNEMETTTLSVEDFLKGPFVKFIQELVCSRRVVIVRLLIAEGHKHPELTAFYFDNVIARGLETLRGLIDRGVARGEFRKTGLRDYPQLLIAPMLMAVIWRALFEHHHHLDTDGMLKTHIDLMVDAVRAPHAKDGAS